MDNSGFTIFRLRRDNMNTEMTLKTGYNGVAVFI